MAHRLLRCCTGRPWPDRAIFWHYPLYLQGSSYGRVIPIHGTDQMYWRATPCSVVRKGDWKLMQFFESGKTELYNIKQDIGEQKDLAASHPEKAAELLKELQKWQAITKAVIPTRLNPSFDPKFEESKRKVDMKNRP